MMANLREKGDEDGICVFRVCEERENKRKRKGGAREIQVVARDFYLFIYLQSMNWIKFIWAAKFAHS